MMKSVEERFKEVNEACRLAGCRYCVWEFDFGRLTPCFICEDFDKWQYDESREQSS